MIRRYLAVVLSTVLACGLLSAGCAENTVSNQKEEQRDTIYQLSTLDSLVAGNYDGFQNAGALRDNGDMGIGTFHELDGELVMIDRKIYKVKDTGKVEEVTDTTKIPFAAVTFFDKDLTQELRDVKDYQSLNRELDKMIGDKNSFYAFRVDGTFQFIKLRSVPKQQKPYPILSEVTKNQPIFEYNDITGSLIGFWCPEYVGSINVPGYHLHFISEDRTKGGHLLDVSFEQAQAFADRSDCFRMQLPAESAVVEGMDMEEEIRKVEQ